MTEIQLARLEKDTVELKSYIQEVLFNRNTTYIDDDNLTDHQRIIRLEQATFRR